MGKCRKRRELSPTHFPHSFAVSLVVEPRGKGTAHLSHEPCERLETLADDLRQVVVTADPGDHEPRHLAAAVLASEETAQMSASRRSRQFARQVRTEALPFCNARNGASRHGIDVKQTVLAQPRIVSVRLDEVADEPHAQELDTEDVGGGRFAIASAVGDIKRLCQMDNGVNELIFEAVDRDGDVDGLPKDLEAAHPLLIAMSSLLVLSEDRLADFWDRDLAYESALVLEFDVGKIRL